MRWIYELSWLWKSVGIILLIVAIQRDEEALWSKGGHMRCSCSSGPVCCLYSAACKDTDAVIKEERLVLINENCFFRCKFNRI